ncbi:MAG: AI-2E family transporter [Campylobacteraceae bacterium]|nr:AI-2E family transporter [Campylobacteraceae bacterium]
MRIQSVLILIASIFVIFAGLKAANSIIVPFALATFIAIVISPALTALEKVAIPKAISFVLVIGCFIFFLGFIGNVTVTTMFDFLGQLPDLSKRFNALLETWTAKLGDSEFSDMIILNQSMFSIESNKIIATTSSLVKTTSGVLSMWFFILILVAFMLFETAILKDKVAYLNKTYPKATLFTNTFIGHLKKYLLVKTIVSILTGSFIGLGLWYLEIPYALLWGIVAFILNYIPTIGSFVAAIPAVILSLIVADFATTFWVIVVYLIPNTILGTILEPRIVGEELGLSTIVVLFSLLLWGYILGIGGLFLAVPLTMSIQIALLINPKTEFIAVILSNKVEKQ